MILKLKLNYFIIFILLIVIFSCNHEKQTLKLIKVTEYSSSKISDSALIKILKQENINVSVEYTLSEDYALEQLNNKNVDLIITPNNTTSNNLEIRSIVPLLPRLLMIITNKKTGDMNLKEVLEKGQVYFEERSRLDTIFFKNLYYNFNIDESKIDSKSAQDLDLNIANDSLLVYVGLTHLNNEFIKKMADYNWSSFSIDNVQDYGKGSKVEGFTLMHRSSYPFIIPKSIYKGKPENSILTIAIKDVLIAREDLDDKIVYKIVKTIVENKSRLIQLNRIYNLIDYDFNSQSMSFPLHIGSRNYIERNKPSIWMQYVNIAWPILSIIVIFLGALTSFRRQLKKKRKENIEKYYASLLLIREKSEQIENVQEIKNLLYELGLLRSKAIEALANNKFDSGESFNIFLALYLEIKNDLNESLDLLKK